MTSILLIEPNSSIKQTKVKDVSQENLYKKCGFKTPNEFSKKHTWNKTINNEKVIIQLWAKETGKANNENKYDFPPPVDTKLFFGTCALVRIDDNNDNNNNIIDLEKSLWTKVYEKLFGGFHDLGNDEDDEISEDELLNVDKHKKTKHGYLKDGFVVDSVTNSDDDNEADIDDDNEANTKNQMNKQEDETSDDNEDDADDGDVDSEDDDMDYADDDNNEEDENMFNLSSDDTITDDFDGSELEESDYEYSDENDN
jgi:hypothetical protein